MQDDNTDSSNLSDYRARLSQALGLPPTQGTIDGAPQNGQVMPPRLGPANQDEPSDPDDPFSTPDQGAGPWIPPQDAAPPPQGEGPATNDGSIQQPGPDDGAGPQVASLGSGGQGPVAVPQGGGSIDGSPTPTLDMAMPNPLDRGTPGLAPQAPTAPTAARAPNAPTAARAPNAPTAPLAPTINGQAGQAAGPSAEMSSDPSQVSPAAAHKNGEKLPDGRPGIQVHPDGFDPDDPSNYKKGAIAKLQADNPNPKPSDVFDIMKPKTQTTYMDWWEKQHGDIEQRYAQMQQDLGTRPDPQRDPTKKEKFQMLMDFGISLLQHSGRNGPYGTNNDVAGVGDALRDATDREQQRKQADTNRFDQQTNMIQANKQADLKDIGNYGNAVREEALIQNAKSRSQLDATKEQIEIAKALKPPKPGQPVTRYDAKGNQYEWDPDSTNPNTGNKGVWQPSVTSSGKPLPTMQVTGPRGGSAKGPPAREAEVNDLVSKGMSTSDAIDRVYPGAKSSDPTKTWSNIYSTARRQGETADDAKDEADRMTASVHGAGALDNARAKSTKTTLPTNSPPASMVPPNKIVTMQDGSKWRNVNGVVQPVQGQ